MAGLSGYEIYLVVTQGPGPEGLVRAADVAGESGARVQAAGGDLRRLTGDMQAAWRGGASDRAAQAAQPIEQALRREQETLDGLDAALRAQAQSFADLKGRVLPVATPEPPDLTLFDQATPWDTDNEVARREWFEADANNRRAYAEYVKATERNQALLPQVDPAAGGPGADTAVQAAGGAGARSASSAPPQVGGGGGSTAPSSAGSGAGGQASAPPSVGAGGGGKTSASNAGGGEEAGGVGRVPGGTGVGAPRQPADRTTVADASALGPSAGVPGVPGVPVVPRPPSGRDTAHSSNVPKGDHLGGAAPVLPGGVGIGDPTGTRGQRGPLGPGERTGVLGRAVPPGPAAVGARAAGTGGVTGMGGFGPHAAHARDEEEKAHKRTVYLDEDTDALVGPLPGSVAPVIGED